MSERYGLNVTWEVARLKERPSSFFSCSLLLCHLNGLSSYSIFKTSLMLVLPGECMVEAKDGKVSRMR